jgi:uncharacterized membrane protein YeaQ/YmgE (transglycosylase-associated protein family)
VPALALVFLLLLVIFAALILLSFQLIGLVLFLAMAGLVGWLADAIVPGELPYGWLGAIAAGLLGSFLGGLLLGPWGPAVFGIHVVPALLGAIVVALVADIVFKKAAPTGVR